MPSASTSSDRTRVLLVDDNEVMMARTAATLAAECVVVGQATDGPAALEAAATLEPDVIVLDISLPGLTGFEVASSLRRSGSRAAIVFLTVHDDEVFLTAARSVGALGYVVKARLGRDLVQAVREARQGRSFVSRR